MTRYFMLLSLFLAGCAPLTGSVTTPQPAAGRSALPDYGPAPELTNTVWLNVDQPLRLANLRGKVVLLEMWTFECINCQHVTPTLKQWYSDYTSRGLVIIGNHFPEFSFEANLDNLKQAVTDQQIPYAVAQDNDGATWQAFHNQYWPTIYLIDRSGHIRYTHIGEGAYTETASAIEALLNEPVD